MARLKARASEAGLREYLLEEAVSFRELFGPYEPAYWGELSKPIDALIDRGPYSFSRYELPDGHPVRREGGIGDCLVLTADDELVDTYNTMGTK